MLICFIVCILKVTRKRLYIRDCIEEVIQISVIDTRCSQVCKNSHSPAHTGMTLKMETSPVNFSLVQLFS